MNKEDLSQAEKELLKGLNKEITPPKKLEEKVVAQLISENLITKKYTSATYLKWMTSIAAALVLFVGGVYYERLNHQEEGIINASNGYILLLQEDENFVGGDPMSMFEEYKGWMENTVERGVKITGQELKSEVAIVKRNKTEVDFHEIPTIKTTGYFIIETESPHEAIAIAQENPHIKYGGTIEVKPFIVR